MTTEEKEFLEKEGYRIRGGYIEKYIDIATEPKIYWSRRPQTFEYQIWGWGIVAHVSKATMFIKQLTQGNTIK